jgi:nicotinamide-nucleotide amidase
LNSPLYKDEIGQLVRLLGQALLDRGATVTLAESCTGGGIAEAITSVPGSSQWFEYGFVTYANAAKGSLLSVKSETLQQFGAVSEQVVCEMAQGALTVSGADYAIAVSGIAGPSGGTIEKPVGTVCICWIGPEVVKSQRYVFAGERQAVREQAIKISLQELLHQVNE